MNLRFRHRRRRRESSIFQKDGTLPLSCLCDGQEGEIIQLNGGHGLIHRLAEMGLTPGVKVKVARKCVFNGPIEVEVRGVNLALGRGVAARVFVKPLRSE